MSVVGQRIKAERERQHISQNKLAKLSGITQPTISAIEAPDQTRSPALDTVEKIARALHCEVSDLMNPESKKEQEAHTDPLRESVIRDYDRLSPDARRLVRQYIDLLQASPPPEAARPNTPADAADPPG